MQTLPGSTRQSNWAARMDVGSGCQGQTGHDTFENFCLYLCTDGEARLAFLH
jgi:hypothetical protein